MRKREIKDMNMGVKGDFVLFDQAKHAILGHNTHLARHDVQHTRIKRPSMDESRDGR